MRRTSLFLSSAILLLLLGDAQGASDRVALVIGNGNYSFAARLTNPANDATDMAQALRDIGFDVIDGIDIDRRTMEEKIRAFGDKLDAARIAIFYYAGHGMQVGGKNFLIPVDAKLQKPADLALDTVDVQVVLQQMEAQQRVNLVFLDACRDNPLARRFASTLGGSRSGAVGQGLASIESAVGTMIAFATAPDNVALDGQGRNSPFTTALLRHIRTPGTDIAVVMRRVRNDVLAATDRRQLPWDHSSLTDAVVLVPDVGGQSNAPAPVASNPASTAGRDRDTSAASPLASKQPAPSIRWKPSFDCAVDRGEAEVAICSSAALSRLDNELSDSYKRAMASLVEPARGALVREQRAWLGERNQCRSDLRCLAARYQERIARLSR
jgi:uncharacterized caspase-like protein